MGLITPEKAHFGGYLMHSDVLILKLWFSVHRILQDCVTDSVSFLRQDAVYGGVAPIAPDPPMSVPFLLPTLSSPPFLFLSPSSVN